MSFLASFAVFCVKYLFRFRKPLLVTFENGIFTTPRVCLLTLLITQVRAIGQIQNYGTLTVFLMFMVMRK